MSRGNTERAFLAARRHSRVVRILRIAVPAAVSFTLVVVVLIIYLNPLVDDRLRVGAADAREHLRLARTEDDRAGGAGDQHEGDHGEDDRVDCGAGSRFIRAGC